MDGLINGMELLGKLIQRALPKHRTKTERGCKHNIRQTGDTQLPSHNHLQMSNGDLKLNLKSR